MHSTGHMLIERARTGGPVRALMYRMGGRK